MSGEFPILVYLAGPIDGVDLEVAKGWRENVALMSPASVLFYTPVDAYLNANKTNFPVVDAINREVIRKSHAMIANLSGEGAGFGTIREIEWAVRNQTSVWVVGEVVSWMSHDIKVVATLDEALDGILELLRQSIASPPHPIIQILGGAAPWPTEDEDDVV